MKRDGFTLVEVIMAMLVLEVGLLGVTGTLVLAARTLQRAERLERAVTEAGRIYDVLWKTGGTGEEVLPGGLGRVRWSVASDGALRVDVVAPEEAPDSLVLAVRGRTLPERVP